ncbi:MAG: cell division/cell wall cluster transcriptional repressor MraZ, partial [Negativicoccus succinicivorans]|nr:cell division/cell wall cluster transcriptional repressor MraZ [Negativicoccus succinicivorans]
MFIGKYSHSVDAKGRMIIPAGFRAELGERFVITRGLYACVTVYPLERWEQVAERLQQLSSTRKEVRMLIR